jgi:hypothetical protein
MHAASATSIIRPASRLRAVPTSLSRRSRVVGARGGGRRANGATRRRPTTWQLRSARLIPALSLHAAALVLPAPALRVLCRRRRLITPVERALHLGLTVALRPVRAVRELAQKAPARTRTRPTFRVISARLDSRSPPGGKPPRPSSPLLSRKPGAVAVWLLRLRTTLISRAVGSHELQSARLRETRSLVRQKHIFDRRIARAGGPQRGGQSRVTLAL